MLYARNLEMLGRTREAADEYRSLIGYALGPEAQVRYGLLMKAMGERQQAEEAFRDAIRTYGRRLNKLDEADRNWIARANRNLAGAPMSDAVIPAEFADLLSPAGKRLLAGTHALCGALADPRTRFLARDDLLDRSEAERLRRTLEHNLIDKLEPLERPIPPETIWEMREDYGELLPKTSRARTIYFDGRREPGAREAERIGLVRLLRSQSLRAFAEALAGRKLATRWGLQVLRYGPGDYAGPHNDHHPENAAARGGYIDLHLSLCSPGVAHQWLVYSRGGHFSEIVSLAGPASITAYRLPFWHYTTPLVAKPGARNPVRWVLLATFLYRAASRPLTSPQAARR